MIQFQEIQYNFIRNQQELPQQILNENIVGVDIEFSNQRICLVQIQCGEQTYILDPLAIDLKEYLTQLFTSDSIKVFFSGQQDLQWLKQEYEIEVQNYCDIKILAQKESDATLLALWNKYCGIDYPREMKKKFQKSDWSRRPLSKEQLYYAALDCRYLIKLREILIKSFSPQELQEIRFTYDLKVPKLQTYIQQQLIKLEKDPILAEAIYKHIKQNQEFQSEDEKINDLVTQLTQKHHNNWKQLKQERFKIFQEKFTCHKPIYSNCKILSKENLQLCFCDEKKLNWYLKNGLAEKISDKCIRLNFEPKFQYDEKEMRFYNEERGNICVVCGAGNNYLKYSVVPHVYKHYLPVEYKSHRAHDVVVLCARCHEKASAQQDKMKTKISKDFNVPLNCYGDEKDIHGKLSYLIKKMMNRLKNKMEIDLGIDYEQLRKRIPLSEEPNLEEMEAAKEEIQKRLKNQHGELVVNQLNTDEKIEDFIMLFRRHFLDSMDPQFLPKEWAIDHRFKRNFGEKSIYHKQHQQHQQQ